MSDDTKLTNSASRYEPPSDEQLERFIFALLQGEAYRRSVKIDAAWGARMVMRDPTLKEVWLQRHRDLAAGLAHRVDLDTPDSPREEG